ncbi:MAG: asparagine synthase (glutamine-hydrolyzing) [Alphaproteobacteria bacterium]
MCGISGIVGPDCPSHLIEKMVAAQTHRGPDSSGTFISSSRQCALGHNRLRIIDLSEAGVQPMADESGNLRITFNGEIYNYIELKEKVGAYNYRSQTDTEVILAAYRKWGVSCVDHMIGMFAFAIWDETKQELFCARDRLGIKPFHYTLQNETLFFASEIKAFLAVGITAKPEWKTWNTYLVHGIYDHSEDTFFEDIKSLPPGHTLNFKNGVIKISQYWNLPELAKDALDISLNEAAEKFRELMMDSVRLRLRSDVPLGVNLSGGLDSSSLLAFVDAQNEAATDLNYFTYAFDDPAYDEIDYADKVPKIKKWHKHVARLNPEQLWDDLDIVMHHQEAPYGGTGSIAYFNLHRLIKKENVTVVLEGQGVDELLAGYEYYRKPAAAGVYQDGTSFLRNECLDKSVTAAAPVFAQPFKSELANRLYRDIRFTKLPRVLRMNDRLSMAFSRELREPFLDHRVVEFCFRLPDNFKLNDRQNKILLREAMKGTLPDAVSQPAKRAVVTPQREWIRGPLRQNILDLISSQRFREYGVFNHVEVKKSFDAFCKGEGDNAFFIWQWINFDSWSQNFIGAQKSRRDAA